jgi:hypothetical protein
MMQEMQDSFIKAYCEFHRKNNDETNLLDVNYLRTRARLD